MSKEIYISSTPHETRLAIVENDALAEIYYERENEYTLAGSIYNGRVTRVLPGMQSSFVDIGLERDAFLYITDFMEEAGDSAEFDAGDGRAARPRTLEGGGTLAAPTEGSSRERSGRRDRGGRDRNEGRRESSQTPGVAPAESVSTEPRTEDAGDVGEGAPGADGGRRWRGRRGRRRGRTAGEEGTPETGAAAPSESSDAGFTADFSSEDAPDVEARSPESTDRPRREGGREGGRDRGRRTEDVRTRFAPRGPRHDADNSETVDLQGSAVQAEPFILPGESLGKYRPGGEDSSRSKLAPAAAAATPSSEVKALEGWDGGAVLPGETIRPRSGGSASAAPREDRGRSRDDRGGRDRGGRERGGRDRNRGERSGERNNAEFAPRRELHPSEAVQPAVSSQHEPEAFELDIPPAAHLDGEVFEQETSSNIEAAADMAAIESQEQQHDFTASREPGEYEPAEDSSASFRVDPVAPSEYRNPSPTPEPQEKLAAAEEFATTVPVFTAHEEDAYEEQSATAQEFTTIEATGEMISAPAEPHTAVEPDPSAPIEHESAVQSVSLAEAAHHAVPAPQSFAPGDGELEEETIDDDDDAPIALHASAHHDDMEEETLEGAADLGAMLREMSIDQITRPQEPAEDEFGDDFDIDEHDMEEGEFGEEADLEDSTGAEADDEFAESDADADSTEGEPAAEGSERPQQAAAGSERPRREGGRDGGRDGGRGRRDGRRDRGGRDRGGDRGGNRDRRSSSSGGFSAGGTGEGRYNGGRMSRSQAQTSNLPAISDLLKPGQELLVQIAKEPIAKKGARITSHIALPGRFLVFMPTVSHTGVSRKIESDGERRRLKEILLSEKGDASGGFIVRTAASGASEEELRSDLRFLLNLWADIKQRSEASKSPALIYHDLNLVERILRDQVTDNFSAIWVDTEDAYERVLRFLQRFQPSLIRRVKLYTKETPLFEQFGITTEIDKALRSKVWLKSGGSIVINQTEALVAIDINTGKFVGKTARLEDTIVKTNLDAIPEIVRQIRLRDLGGIIIIDFIDMDERKNRNKVMAALEEELKSDRAPSKVLQFNDFGLVAITRKRVKQSLERTLSTTCGVCQGTGMVKSPVTVANDIYIEMRKMQKHLDRGDVMLRVNPEVVKQLKAPGTKWLQEMEEMVGKTILVKSDPTLHPEQFDIH